MFKPLAVTACALLVVACGSDEPDLARADIAHVEQLKSSFGPEFQVTSVGPTGIDPRLLAPQPVPPGVKFEPADCAKFATGQLVPAGLKGNMAATTAEGEGNRFITMAVETSEPVPLNEPGQNCRKIGFAGGASRGLVEVVESPQISGAQTLGTHRVLQTVVDGKPRTGELYNYVATFGTFLVIVTANPLVVLDEPVAEVDTERARRLLTEAVAAVQG